MAVTAESEVSTTIEKPFEHLLENKWVLWYRPPANHSNSVPKAAQWEDSQKTCFEADSVEAFWRGFHNLARIRSGHPVNCDYSLFKHGVKPMWEDEFNKGGGRWTFNIERRQSRAPNNVAMPDIIEQIWLDVMLCLIGEGFDPYGDKIAGGVCGIRNAKSGGNSGRGSGDIMAAKIHIWTRDASDVETNLKIGQILKSVVQAADNQLSFSPHEVSPGNKSRNDVLRV